MIQLEMWQGVTIIFTITALDIAWRWALCAYIEKWMEDDEYK